MNIAIATINHASDTTFLETTLCDGEEIHLKGFDIQFPADSTFYFLTLTNEAGCDSVISLYTTVNPVFNTTIYDTILVNEQYEENGFEFEGLDHPGNKILSKTYTSIYGCDSNVFVYLKIMNGVSVKEASTEHINIYPNPVNDILNIETGSDKIRYIQIIDITGKVLLSAESQSAGKTEVDVKDLSAGCYFLRLTATDGTKRILKFIKKKE